MPQWTPNALRRAISLAIVVLSWLHETMKGKETTPTPTLPGEEMSGD